MNEEKLYAVKNSHGQVWCFEEGVGFWWPLQKLTAASPFTTTHKEAADEVVNRVGGHVVTLIEEPKKVVVSPEEAKLVKNCLWTNSQESFLNNINLLFRGRRPEDVTRLKGALTDGYTVAKEKKYLVYKELGGKQKNKQVAQAYRSSIYPGTISWILTNEVKSRSWAQFTESEIEHYGLQDCEKEEVTDDEQ